MAHQLYNGARTMLIFGDAMGATRGQAVRMLNGAAALRVASANLAAARQSRAVTRDRLAASEERLARAKAARAALKG